MVRRDEFRAASMRKREEAHRRLVLTGIGALLLLALSPVIGHHISSSADAALMGEDHFGAVCVIALHTLLAPLHSLFHLLLFAGLGYAVIDRAKAAWRLRKALACVVRRSDTATDSIAEVLRELGVAPDSVAVVNGLPNPAFTAGWWNPRIYIAGELADTLSHPQLVAVLRHEAAHARRRDPLRLSLLRFLGCTLFWIPAFRRLAADMADEAEIDADDAAVAGHPLVLASAILSLAAWRPKLDPASDAVFKRSGAYVSLVEPGALRSKKYNALLDRRVRRLAGDVARVSSHLTRRSLVGAAFVLSAVWISGVAVAHPMRAAGTHGAHCIHQGMSAFSHLFCRHDTDARAVGGSTDCPHATTE